MTLPTVLSCGETRWQRRGPARRIKLCISSRACLETSRPDRDSAVRGAR
jgi:hypothetical protein